MTILHIDTSINGENSASRAAYPFPRRTAKTGLWGEEIVYRDLAADPLPPLDARPVCRPFVIDEFFAADTIVIGAPMYNFGFPSQLKAWIDRIAIAGKHFSTRRTVRRAWPSGKRVIIALARGGIYDAKSPAAEFEYLETYLRGVFNFIGIEPEFVVAEGLAVSPEQRDIDRRGARPNASPRRLMV